MHGILGNKVNMRTFSKNLAGRNPSWRFILLDHRGHGGSPSPAPPHDVEACAADAVETLSSLQLLPTVHLVIGHSFGGKVALEVTRQLHARRSAGSPLHAWVLDSVPDLVPEDETNPESVSSVLAQVGDVPMPVRSKEHLLEELGRRNISKTLADWMTTNLQSDAASGGYVWKFDAQLIDALFRAYKCADYMPFLSSLPAEVCVRLVMASRNPHWTPERIGAIEAAAASSSARGGGEVSLHSVESGHWVHIEAAKAVSALIQEHSMDRL